MSEKRLLRVVGGEYAGCEGRLLSALPDRVLLQLVPGGLLAVVAVADIEWPAPDRGAAS